MGEEKRGRGRSGRWEGGEREGISRKGGMGGGWGIRRGEK